MSAIGGLSLDQGGQGNVFEEVTPDLRQEGRPRVNHQGGEGRVLCEAAAACAEKASTEEGSSGCSGDWRKASLLTGVERQGLGDGGQEEANLFS